MMKKLAALMCGILCVCLLSVPVYAESGGPAITITEGDDESGAIVVGVTGQEPVSTTAETVEGVPYITKVYKLPQGTVISAFTASFEQDGYLFAKHDISQQVQPGQTDSKTVTQTETVETETDKIADIVAAAKPMLPYSEDGYAGQLALDVAAIVVEENGSSTYSYRLEDVREYTNLDRNDAAYIPKTVLKNGVTLQLENIEWVVMGQHPVDGRMVPNLFKAVATYAGTATGSRANGYTATLTYKGEVTKTVPGETVYTIVFRGELLDASGASPDVSEPAPGEQEEKKSGMPLFLLIMIILLAAACFAVAGVRIVQRIRDKRGERDEDFPDYDSFADEVAPAEPVQMDACPIPQKMPKQVYPQDDFSIDELFSEEGFFDD
ncbi:hypothetical protein LJC60_06735 [Ruminococcaceae bacterium OttesenSCG-928-D13]|nr:hypothetical protein [Ruminococcaceae bacterium OttesenSCG-928-D13]